MFNIGFFVLKRRIRQHIKDRLLYNTDDIIVRESLTHNFDKLLIHLIIKCAIYIRIPQVIAHLLKKHITMFNICAFTTRTHFSQEIHLCRD